MTIPNRLGQNAGQPDKLPPAQQLPGSVLGNDNLPTPSVASGQPTSPVVHSEHRRRGDAQMLEITGRNPEYDYRWVRSRNDENHLAVSRAKLKGYQLVYEKEGVRTLVEPDKQADGTIRIGDLVLMKIRKDHKEARVREKRTRNEQLLAATSAETEEMAKRKGVVTVPDPDHNRVVEKPTP